MCDCVMQEQAGLRQQVGSLTASLRVAEQAQSSAEAAVQEERLRSAEATQVNRLTTCVALLLPFPPPPPSCGLLQHIMVFWVLANGILKSALRFWFGRHIEPSCCLLIPFCLLEITLLAPQ